MSAEPFEPDLALWEAWHPSEVARRLAGVDGPWAIAAGWALDLFAGRQTRPHDDLEIAVPASGFPSVRAALLDVELFVVGDGFAYPLDERSLEAHYQTWARERETGLWRLDVMREPWEGETWVYRRDERLRRPASTVVETTTDGIPFLAPEIVLLFKAKRTREKDEADFDGVLPLLGRDQRLWLAEALELVHPGHPWLERLDHG